MRKVTDLTSKSAKSHQSHTDSQIVTQSVIGNAKKKFRSPTARTAVGLVVVALFTGTALAIPSEAASARLGGLCTKAQRGKVSGSLVCRKSGSRSRWFKRTAASPSGATPDSGGAVSSSGATAGLPVPISVSLIPFGAAPTGATTKVDLTCSGLAGATATGSGTVSFPSTGGTNSISLAVQAPSGTNPTGTTCAAVATSSVTASLRILVDGSPNAGPSPTTVSAASFTTVEGTKVTVLVDYTGVAAPTASSIAPTATTIAGSPTTVLGATTTAVPTALATTYPTVVPPSGKVEIATTYLTAAPPVLLGVTGDITCSPSAFGLGFQSQTLRFDKLILNRSASVALAPAAPGFSGTACQVDFSLISDSASIATLANTNLRILINGQLWGAPATGTSIKSGTFDAQKPFILQLELSFPGQPAAAPTTPTTTGVATVITTAPGSATTTVVPATTILGATTTTVGTVGTSVVGATTSTVAATTTTITPAATAPSNISLTRTGTPPANLDKYDVTVTCTNAIQSGVAQASVTWNGRFPPTGATAPLSFTQTAQSVCSIAVASLPTAGTTAITTGTITVIAGSVVRASGTGSASGSGFAAPTAFDAAITVAY